MAVGLELTTAAWALSWALMTGSKGMRKAGMTAGTKVERWGWWVQQKECWWAAQRAARKEIWRVA